MTQPEDLQKMTVKELTDRIATMRSELAVSKLQQLTKKEKNVHISGNKRKTIARMLTLVRQHKLAGGK